MAKAPVKTASKAPPPPASDDTEISDDEALALLASASATPASGGDASDLTDDEALALLGTMDEDTPSPAAPKASAAPVKPQAKAAAKPQAPAKPTPKAPPALSADEEAMAMMAGMDTTSESADEGEMSDEDARKLLADMDAPVAATPTAEQDEMSDDEARRLLAEMDEPPSAAPTEATADDDGGDMSDDEARRLLSEMDAPAAALTPTPAPKASTKPPKAAAPAAGMSADDEALGLLAAMGGLEHADPAPAPAAKPAPARSPAATAAPAAAKAHQGLNDDDESSESDEALEEIDEFSSNDFASDPDMLNDFMTNSDELMETLDATILELEQKPDDKETIESIFRAAHTLKGAAGMFGFKAIERVMHRMENLFDKVRKGTLRPDSNIIDVVFQGFDVLRALLNAVRNGKPSGTKTVPIVRALELAVQGKYVKGEAKSEAAASGGGRADHGGSEGGGGDHGGGDGGGGGGGGGGGEKKRDVGQSTIRVDLERLDALVNLVGELVIDRTRFASIEEEIRTTQPQLPVSSNMTETVQLFGRHMNEIHEIIMKIRMVPSRETSAPYALRA
jgi:two-component system chemotaxis sensor kinase CheA